YATPLRHIADAEPVNFMRRQRGNLAAIDADRAGAGALQAGDGVAKRRLAHAVAADDRQDTAFERQRDALEGMAFAVIDLQVVDAQDGLARFAGRRSTFSHACPRDRSPALPGRLRSPAACLP